ncbi:ATP-binding protein [Chitinophaga sp. HK235]|uniref:ATP-binding protein n=1 Tax=Chitinophaga sp. HK235 TaxID=2952571 RepID=UPI001BA559E4|nr:ATP-binding protein [Chitinophaga sp. HK235]
METIIFCGIQATGKSTFYQQHFFHSHLRISLDLFKTRHREDLFLEACFKSRLPFVVDNTNPGKADRQKYIQLAKQHKFRTIGYYFQSRIEDALQRNSQRSGKACIPEIGIRGVFNKLELPAPDEGFDELYYVTIDDNNFVIKPWTNEI